MQSVVRQKMLNIKNLETREKIKLSYAIHVIFHTNTWTPQCVTECRLQTFIQNSITTVQYVKCQLTTRPAVGS